MVTALMWNECRLSEFPADYKQPEPPGETKGRQRRPVVPSEWKRLSAHISSVAAKKSLFVSGEFQPRYRAARPPTAVGPAQPWVRHCGKVWYEWLKPKLTPVRQELPKMAKGIDGECIPVLHRLIWIHYHGGARVYDPNHRETIWIFWLHSSGAVHFDINTQNCVNK